MWLFIRGLHDEADDERPTATHMPGTGRSLAPRLASDTAGSNFESRTPVDDTVLLAPKIVLRDTHLAALEEPRER